MFIKYHRQISLLEHFFKEPFKSLKFNYNEIVANNIKGIYSGKNNGV